MKKKLRLIVLALLLTCSSVQAKKLTTAELVDLHKSHWAYKATEQIIDKYGLLQAFPDHTFRGEKAVNRYEFSVIILNMITYLENTRKLTFRPAENISGDFKNKSLADIPKKCWARPAVQVLKDNYSMILSPPYDKSFSGKKNINRFELAYAVDKIISLIPGIDFMDKNPYEARSPEQSISQKSVFSEKLTASEWYEKSVKNIVSNKIMAVSDSKNDFKGLEEINRYQLAIVLIKTLEYLDTLKK